jgi:hypothetical protein
MIKIIKPVIRRCRPFLACQALLEAVREVSMIYTGPPHAGVA